MNTNREIPQFSTASKKSIAVYGLLIGVIIIALILTGIFVIGRLTTTPAFIPPGLIRRHKSVNHHHHWILVTPR